MNDDVFIECKVLYQNSIHISNIKERRWYVAVTNLINLFISKLKLNWYILLISKIKITQNKYVKQNWNLIQT